MRIVIKNLPERTTEAELRERFEKYGVITDIYILRTHEGISKGIAFIGFLNEEMAKKAITIRNNTYIENRKIIVEKDKSKKFDVRQEENIDTSQIKIINLSKDISEENLRNFFNARGKIKNLKLENGGEKNIAIIEFREKETARKLIEENLPVFGCRTIIYPYVKNERKNYFNSLFFDFKNILRRISEKEKIAEKDLIDISKGDLATKVSLLETHLIQETKAFLETNNIFLDNILSGKNKRGLIVRNFDLMGDISKLKCEVRISPSKTLALFFFKNEIECKIIFNRFNRMRVKNQQIFCEYIPNTNSTSANLEFTDKLIVKNLPFQASQEEIKKLLESQVKIKNIRLPMKNHEQHRGFCFVSLYSARDARIIYEYFGKNTHLYGRRLIIEVAS